MKANELTPNLRVEYAARAEIWIDSKEVKAAVKKQFVGYVKRVYRKRFTTYADICECRTRRIDRVRIKDIFGIVPDREKNNKNDKQNGD